MGVKLRTDLIPREKRVLTTKELSAYTGWTVSHIHHLTCLGLLPYSKPNGKLCFFDKDDVHRYLKAHKKSGQKSQSFETRLRSLKYFLRKYGRKPKMDATQKKERSLANFLYRTNCSGTMEEKDSVTSLLEKYVNDGGIATILSTDEILNKIKAFILENGRFPQYTRLDKYETYLSQRARYYVKCSKSSYARRVIEDMVIKYDVNNTCQLFCV